MILWYFLKKINKKFVDQTKPSWKNSKKKNFYCIFQTSILLKKLS